MRNIKKYEFAFQLYIEIKDSKPTIWRRVLVPVNYSFEQLHQVIQTAFEWEDQHLHQFTLFVKEEGFFDLLRFEPILDDFEPFDSEALNENEHFLKDHLNVGMHLEYYYDFGDDWIHNIVVEGHLIQAKKQKYPECIDGGNHHAFEDIGGIFGYQHAIEILADTQHEEHKELKSWLKESYGASKINKFDPTTFDPKKIKFKLN